MFPLFSLGWGLKQSRETTHGETYNIIVGNFKKPNTLIWNVPEGTQTRVTEWFNHPSCQCSSSALGKTTQIILVQLFKIKLLSAVSVTQ